MLPEFASGTARCHGVQSSRINAATIQYVLINGIGGAPTNLLLIQFQFGRNLVVQGKQHCRVEKT